MPHHNIPHELRDSRGSHFTRVDDEFIDGGYMARLTAAATVAYLFLCRRANRDGISFPGSEDWQSLAGLSRPTVNAAMKQLIDEGLVSVEHRPGASHVYRLEKIFTNEDTGTRKENLRVPVKISSGTRKENLHEVDTSKKSQSSSDSLSLSTRAERKVFSNGDADAALTAERRADVFAAYADVFGIREGTAEWFRRWNKATADLLPDVLETLTSDRMRELSHFVLARRISAGLTHTPDVSIVLEAESEFDRRTFVPNALAPAATNGKRTGGAARGGMTPDELIAWGEARQREIDSETRGNT